MKGAGADRIGEGVGLAVAKELKGDVGHMLCVKPRARCERACISIRSAAVSSTGSSLGTSQGNSCGAWHKARRLSVGAEDALC